MMNAFSVAVPESRMTHFAAKLNALQNKAKRMNAPPLQWRIAHSSVSNGMACTWVTIVGEAPRFNGWRLIARYDFDMNPETREVACITNAVPGETVPDTYRVVGTVCQHCGHARRRNNVFLLEHDDRGFIIVGRQCIAAFLGVSVEQLAWAYTFERIASARDEEWEGTSWHVDGGSSVLSVLANTAAVVRRKGWRSQAVANVDDTGGASTANLVSYVMGPPPRGEQENKYFRRFCEEVAVEERDWDTARAIVQWVSDVSPGSEWIETLKAIVRLGWCKARRFPILCSAIVGYERELARAAEREERIAAAKQGHIGEVKQRITFAATITAHAMTQSEYGYGTRINMRDDEGHEAVWFASKSISVEVGQRFMVTATVKKHGTFGRVDQTTLTRVKLDAMIPEQIN